MASIATFQSTRVFLKDILREIDSCRIQLPDFQRSWVWDDYRIRSLLASVSLSFPIGAVMMLETGNSEAKFKPRPIEGVQRSSGNEPKKLVLDGQQRLTALYRALIKEGPVLTEDAKKNAISRYYYLDIERCLDPEADREECVRSIAEDRKVWNFRGAVLEDYTAPESEYAAGLFPVRQMFDSFGWMKGYQK